MAEDGEASPHRFVSSASTAAFALEESPPKESPRRRRKSTRTFEELQELDEAHIERLERSQARLEELDQQKVDRRKARFREQREVHSQKSRVERQEAELLREEEKVRQQSEPHRKIEAKLEARVQDIWNDHVSQIPSIPLAEAARLARLEEQKEVLTSLDTSGELVDIDRCLATSIWEDDVDIEKLRATSKALTVSKKEQAEALAELAKLRAGSQDEVASATGDEADELRMLQELHSQLQSRLKSEAPAAAVVAPRPVPAKAASVPTVAATPVTPATGVAASPVVSTATTATCAPMGSSAIVQGEQASSVDDLPLPPAKAPASKGKSKGKGKGVAPKLPPPPPPCKSAPATMVRREAPLKKSNMLNLYWKVLKDQPPITDPSLQDGGFSRKNAKLVTDIAPPLQAAPSPALALEASAVNHRRQQLRLPPETFDTASASTAAPSQRDTVFSSPVDVVELPPAVLEAYFKARTAVKLGASVGGDADAKGTEALLETKFLQMLGIAVQKYVMANKKKGVPDATQRSAAVLAIKQAVLQCDYKIVQQEILVLIRTVLIEHRTSGSKVTKRVQERGEASLLLLRQSAEHCLIHELLKVPQIEERLESMLFHNEFGRLRLKCLEDMEILKQALEVLDRKCLLLKKFFQTALKMGQGLNRDSRAPQAENGFQLTSLEKLVQTKSPKFPKHNVLHFVLALMEPKEAEQLFTPEDIALLLKAKALKSYTVHQDCQELVEGFYGVRDICETGAYKGSSGQGVKMERRRKTMVPGMRPAPDKEADSTKENEAPIDTDDCFHEIMKEFVDANVDEVKIITEGWWKVMSTYKDLGNFFCDLNSVYPPPRDDNSPKVDLIAVFHGLAEHVRVHREEVEQDGLRALLNAPQPAAQSAAAEPADAAADIATDASSPPLPAEAQAVASQTAAAPAASLAAGPPKRGVSVAGARPELDPPAAQTLLDSDRSAVVQDSTPTVSIL